MHAPLPRGEGAPDSPPSLPILWSDGPLPVWMSLSSGKRAGSPVTWGILASHALDPSVSCPLLCATLLWQDQTSPLTILLDSGADESFIDRELVHQLGIDTVPLDSPIETQALDGRPLARLERLTVPVNLLVSGNHHESISLLVISSPLSPVVLGYPLLKTHNPQIDWATGRGISWSTHCLSHCLRSAQSPRASELGSTSAPPDLSSSGGVSRSRSGFSKSHSLSLPPHRPYDCASPFFPGPLFLVAACSISPVRNGSPWRTILESPSPPESSAHLRCQ